MRTPTHRPSITLLLVALVTTLLLGPAISQTHADAAPGDEYVNMGDSYAAGTGMLPWSPGKSVLCWQSPNNYAHLIAARTGYRLNDVSCGAASTQHFYSSQHPGVPPQLDALSSRTRVVTVMIGGNNQNAFVDTFFGCSGAGLAAALQGSPCRDRSGTQVIRTIQTSTYRDVVDALRAVRTRAPNATVAIINYPWVTPPRVQPCAGLPLTPVDVRYTHDVQVALNDTVRRAAATAGVKFIDVATASVGHDACTPPGVRWVEPLVPSTEPYPLHPTALGHAMISGIVQRSLGL